MKTMRDYILYCTPEQTKRAYKLGAPIENFSMFRYDDNSLPKYIHLNEYNRKCFSYCHTAEQMCGWLREKGLHVEIMIYSDALYQGALYKIHSFDDNMKVTAIVDTYEQAILAAIDAALDYLEKGE